MRGIEDITVVEEHLGEEALKHRKEAKRRHRSKPSTEKKAAKKEPRGRQKRTKKKQSKAPKIIGIAYISPPIFYIVAHSEPGVRTFMVDDTVSREAVRESIAMKTQQRKVFVVDGVRNLAKLGAKSKPRVGVVVHDIPEVLEALSAHIRIIDAQKRSDGTWHGRKLQMEECVEAAKTGGYGRPIHPSKVRKVLASFVAEVPSFDKNFKAEAALDEVFNGVREDYRETLQLRVFRFLAGIAERRGMAGARRAALHRLRSGISEEQYKRLWLNLQRWIESDTEGRRVTRAYQLVAKKQVASAPLAAARTGAELSVLLRLVRFIPPSRKLDFKGYKYTPSQGD